jgi:ABC-type Fe3+-hydroxamate transport system substrate-binding protein
MPDFIDQTGRTVTLNYPPSRIISLVPSQTELLSDLGLEEETIGITKFCVHPPHWYRKKVRVGGTKKLNIDLITQLSPDLIIANKEENSKDDIEVLANRFPVWISDINTYAGAIEMIRNISTITSTQTRGEAIINDIGIAFNKLNKARDSFSVCYLIWQDPLMTVGRDTFIHDMLEHCGFHNVFDNKTRYPIVSLQEIAVTQCDYILLSSEPYPFREKHVQQIESQLQPFVNETSSGADEILTGANASNGQLLKAYNPIALPRAVLVNGEYFSWYGSRLIRAATYFHTLIDNLQHAAGTAR